MFKIILVLLICGTGLVHSQVLGLDGVLEAALKSVICLVNPILSPVISPLLKVLIPLNSPDLSLLQNKQNIKTKFYAWNKPYVVFDSGKGLAVDYEIDANSPAKVKEIFEYVFHSEFFLIFHDVGGSGHDKWIPEIMQAILNNSTYDGKVAISVDYKDYVPDISTAYENLNTIANQTADLLKMIIRSEKKNRYYFIAHGIGAQIAARTSEIIKMADLAIPYYFTALDPEVIESTPDLLKLCNKTRIPNLKDAADYVRVGITSACAKTPLIQACNTSLTATLGHTDIYINGGADQKGCEGKGTKCSRDKIVEISNEVTFQEMYGTKQPFYFWQCSDLDSFNAGKCPNCVPSKDNPAICKDLTFYNKMTEGKFYLNVSATAPYGRGKDGNKP